MVTMLIIIFLIIIFALISISAWQPKRSEYSQFELNRRADSGDLEAKRVISREEIITDVMALRRLALVLLLILAVPIALNIWNWFGIIVLIAATLAGGLAAQSHFVKKIVNDRLIARIESKIFMFTKRYGKYVSFLRSESDTVAEKKIGSREELTQLVLESGDVLTDDEQLLVAGGLAFYERQVSTVMTPRNEISSISRHEFLGPLTLDDLHKLGRNNLLVFDGDIDHIIGVLHLNSLLALDEKRSKTAERAMEPKVFYVRNDQTLYEALAIMLDSRRQLLAVVNAKRQTVGLVTLRDIVEALFGRDIKSGGKAYDNLREIVED